MTGNSSAIRNRQFTQQIKDFSGLKFDKIMPTDIDGFLDFGNGAFVFIEAKHGDSKPSTGQRVALERLCSAAIRGGVPSIVLIAKHEAGPGCDIDLGALPVTEVFMDGQWQEVKQIITVRESVIRFINKHGKQGYKFSDT